MYPLFLTEFDPWADELEQSGSVTGRSTLYVNRMLLDQMIDDADQCGLIAEQLQKTINNGPLDKSAIAALQQYLLDQIPDLQLSGFSAYPFCTPLPLKSTDKNGEYNNLAADENTLILYCSAAVMLSRRSRQSMGILHELGQLQLAESFSPAVVQLFAC